MLLLGGGAAAAVTAVELLACVPTVELLACVPAVVGAPAVALTAAPCHLRWRLGHRLHQLHQLLVQCCHHSPLWLLCNALHELLSGCLLQLQQLSQRAWHPSEQPVHSSAQRAGHSELAKHGPWH